LGGGDTETHRQRVLISPHLVAYNMPQQAKSCIGSFDAALATMCYIVAEDSNKLRHIVWI